MAPFERHVIDDSAATPTATSTQHHAPPVFLHTTWRSGGTWLWSRFCAVPRTAGFYEPLHEGLRLLRPHQIGTLHANVWESGHPAGHGSYFESYRSLLDPAGGVAGFPVDDGPHHFFAADDAALPSLEAYVARLLRIEGTPVLKFCRSAGRLGWMRRRFPGACHIIVSPNPASQWASMQRQNLQQGNSYFITMPGRLLQACRHQPRVAQALQAMRAGGDHSPGEQDYRAFLTFWLLTNCFEMAERDLLVNLDLLASSRPYRASCEYEVRAATGLQVDLAGIRPAIATPLDPAWLGLSLVEVLRCHRDAMDYVLGAGLTDSAAARVAGALFHAGSLVFDRSGALAAQTTGMAAEWQHAERNDGLMREALATASRRAIVAEAQLRDIHASRCWALTEPLRQLGERLKRWNQRSDVGLA